MDLVQQLIDQTVSWAVLFAIVATVVFFMSISK